MLLKILIALQVNCAPTKFINHTDKEWTPFDKKTYERALHVCKTYYRLECLTRFEKHPNRHYVAICGGDVAKKAVAL